MLLKRITIALFLGSMAALSACNTIEGVGRDVKSVGQAVENTAQ